MRFAIIGAGLAGAACARAISAAGQSVQLFDKGRGAGGRLSTRRAQTQLGEVRLDHGAQFLTVEDRSFQSFIDEAVAENIAAEWTGRLVTIDRHGNLDAMRPRPRYVGRSGMNQIVKYALSPFDTQFARRAKRMQAKANQWQIEFEDGSVETGFEKVVLTLPPEQLIEFLALSDGDFSDIIYEAKQSVIRPCWTVMSVSKAPFDPGFDGAKIYGGGIRWIARMASRPGHAEYEAVILQASPSWSEAFLESDAETVQRMVCEEAYIRFALPEPVWASAHRWRYSMVETPASTPFAINETGSVGVAGDWRIGGRAEAAWISGHKLGQRMASGS
jgi:predicted NAD/FAD-dependent oxidoreductase